MDETQNKLEDKELKVKLDFMDMLAMIIALVQLILPFVIGGVIIYFLIILFITKFWFRV